MVEAISFFKLLVDVSGITRYHAQHVLIKQNVAEHSFGVAVIAAEIYKRMRIPVPSVLLLAALHHDMPEIFTGDIPSPAKRLLRFHEHNFSEQYEQQFFDANKLVSKKALTTEEKFVLKFADHVEGMLYCCRERMMGNKRITETLHNYEVYQRLLIGAQVEADKGYTVYTQTCLNMLEDVCKSWREART